ncbi:ABC transporter ATP-binding protein [Thioalkalivibrio sp. HK1]|uniref:ABC transporter ATP-binding protein n=1 Tax=Thioalkalivibrio sp. HK1 TaxID=1469245 RepID=UPI0018CC481B|nr:ABC transporter ATP-binding protein [Thioalkalivibrio sp. HK1]
MSAVDPVDAQAMRPPALERAPRLRVESIHHAFGSLVVSDDVSLDIAPGECHGLIGPNGAGKSTLFDIIAGEIIPLGGGVHLDGKEITGEPPDRRARLGLARSFQHNDLFAELTVRENLIVGGIVAHGIGHVAWRALARERSVCEKAEMLAMRLGLEDVLDTEVHTLSYGTRRQLEIALALEMEPKVLLLDEPTAGMSPEETVHIQERIADSPPDLALLIVEHDMDVLFGLADRVTVLDYGRVLLQGDAEEVRASDIVRQRYLGTDPVPTTPVSIPS